MALVFILLFRFTIVWYTDVKIVFYCISISLGVKGTGVLHEITQ